MAVLVVSWTCLIFAALFPRVTVQRDVVQISDPFNPYQDSSRHATGSHINSNAGYGKTYRSAHIFRSGKGVLGGTHVVRGFGSECSLEHQCNALLGLACTSNGKRMSRCACAPSTPVYVNEGGVQKCVRPKDIYEGCVSSQECNFKNPNAQCVNFLCNCSQPFQLTAARLCQLPSSPAGNIFPAAISVMLLLAVLVAGGGYAYQKMLRDRGRSSSLSTKAGASARADTSSTSSTTHEFGEGWAWGRGREYRDSESNMLLEPRRLRTQSEVSLPRHPPRYISYKASRCGVMGLSTLHECCSQAEHSSAASESDPQCVSKDEQEKVAVEASLLRRTSEKRDLACQKKCEIEAKPEHSVPTSSTPIDMMLPKDEQIRKLLNDDREIVVTVETRKGRHRLLTTPSPPPVFTLPKRGLPPLYESTTTDDPFMKDLKRRRGRLGGRYSADLSTAVTASTLRSTSPSVTATGRPSRGTALTAVPKVQRADAFPTMHAVLEASALVHGLPMPAETTEQRLANLDSFPTCANKMAANGKSVSAVRKGNDPTQAYTQQSKNDKRPGQKESEDRPMRGKYLTATPNTSTALLTNTFPSPEIRPKSTEKSENSQGSAAEQSTISMRTVLDATVPRRSSKSEGQQLRVIDDLDILTASPRNTEKVSMTKQRTKAKAGVNSTEAVVSPPVAFTKTDATDEAMVHPSDAENVHRSSKSQTHLGTAGTSRNGSNTNCTEVGTSPESRLLRYENSGIVQAEQVNLAQVGEIASQLLLGLVEVRDREARAAYLDCTASRDVHSVSRLEKSAPGGPCIAANPAPVSVRANEVLAEPTVKEHLDLSTRVIKHDVKTGTHRPPTKLNESPSDEPIDYNSESYVSEKDRDSKVNSAVLPSVLKSANVNPSTEKCPSDQLKPRVVTTPPSVEIVYKTSVDMCPQVKFTTAGPSPPAHGLNQRVADDANFGIRETSEKTQQQRILEDHSRSVNSEDALTIENELIKISGVREPGESTFETRDHSPSFPEAGGLRRALCRRACTPSFISEKAPSLSFQKPYKELMVKISEHQIRFAERPFVDVLASLESEFTTIVKDEQKVDMPDEKEETPSDPQLPETNNEPGSDRYDEDSGNLGEKALESFLADDEATDFEPDASSGEAVETCTSTESAKVQSRHSTASPADAATKTTLKTTVITLKSDESSKLKVLPAYSASSKHSIPSSKYPSLITFETSNKGCNTSNQPSNLDELRKSVQSVTAVTTAATSKAGNCANLSAELQVRTSSVSQTQSLQPPASLRSDINFQAQLAVSSSSLRPHWNGREFSTAIDLPLTEDVQKVVTLENEPFVRQHGAQQREVKTATWLGETRYVLPHIQDPGQLGITPKPQHNSPGSLNQLDGALTQGSHKFIQEPLNKCPAASSNTDIKGHESRNASFEPLELKDLNACRAPGIDKRASTLRMFKTFNVPPLRTLCSQVLPTAETVEEKHTAAAKSNVETPSCSSCTRLDSGTMSASPNKTPSKKKSRRARLSLDALADTTATCAGHEEAALSETKQHRRGRSQSVVITGVTHEWSYQEPGPSRKINEAAAAAITAAKGSIRFVGPPASQNIVVLPGSSVAIRLPEGARQTNVWAPATGTSLRRGSLGTGLAARHRHLQVANALEYPSFESIYNAILQAVPPPAETAMGEPGDVPSRPARRASSASRTVSFDNSPTVVPLEPPPEPSAGRDLSQMDSVRAATPPQIHRPRRRSSLSSLCCSSSGSLLQEVADTTDLIAILDARRASLQLASLRLEQESTPDSVVSAAKNSADPETTPIVASATQTATSLTSSFYSFEDTVSELSFLPDMANVNSSGSLPASQRTEEAGARDQHRGSPA